MNYVLTVVVFGLMVLIAWLKMKADSWSLIWKLYLTFAVLWICVSLNLPAHSLLSSIFSQELIKILPFVCYLAAFYNLCMAIRAGWKMYRLGKLGRR